LFIFTWTLFFC